MDPEFGVSIKDNKFNSVDLPEPEGPINEYILPFSKEKLRSFKTLIFVFVKYFFEIFLKQSYYSYLSVLTVSNEAAREAGKIETIIVINMEHKEIRRIDLGSISDGILLKK